MLRAGSVLGENLGGHEEGGTANSGLAIQTMTLWNEFCEKDPYLSLSNCAISGADKKLSRYTTSGSV